MRCFLMRFQTHGPSPKTEHKKSVEIMLAVSFGLLFALLLFSAIACSFFAGSFMPAVVVLTPFLTVAILVIIIKKDMDRAYVEIVDHKVTIIDYYFGVKRGKSFLTEDIAYADAVLGCSMRVHGYRYSAGACTYIVFRDNSGRYMFKIICSPETKQYFQKYLTKL